MLADSTDTVYPECRELVEALDGATAHADPRSITREVESVLRRLAGAGRIELPEALRAPCPDSYARRLIHHNAAAGYSVLSMVWGPGQGTPLHDHAGLWCVEGVVEGRIEVTQYDLVERQESRCRFEAQETVEAGVGSSGRLIPPFDYHTIANACDKSSAVTIHVYGGEMTRCRIYEPVENGWYRERERELTYTA